MPGFDDYLASSPFGGQAQPFGAPQPAPQAPVSPTGGSSILDRLMKQSSDSMEKETKALGEIRTKEMSFKPPDAPVLPPPPKPTQTSPVEAWGSAAMIFAALAPMFVRTHATTAMNAAAGALKGIQAKDKEQTDYNMEVWKESTKASLDLANFRMGAYDALMRQYKEAAETTKEIGTVERQERESQLKTLGIAFQDAGALQALERGGLEALAEYQKKLRESTLQYQKAGDGLARYAEQRRIIDSPEFKDAQARGDTAAMQMMLLPTSKDPEAAEVKMKQLEERSANDNEKEKRATEKEEADVKVQAKRLHDEWLASPEGQAASPADRAKHLIASYQQFQTKNGRVYPDPSTLQPEERQAVKDSFMNYEQKWPSVFQQKDLEGWSKLEKELKADDPAWNPARYVTIQKMRDKLASGKDADAIASYTRLAHHLEFFSGLIDKLSDGTPIKALDGIAAAWGRQTGNPNITSYETAMEMVGDEMVKAATGTGAAGALADRESIKKNFDPSLDKQQLHANVDAVRKLVGGAIASTMNKYRTLPNQNEVREMVGLTDDQLREYGLRPEDYKPRVTGPVRFGNATVNITEDGAQAAPGAAPAQQQKPQIRKRKSTGETVYQLGGKIVDAKGQPVDAGDVQ